MVSNLGSRLKHVFGQLVKVYEESEFFRNMVTSFVLSFGFIVIGAFAVKVNAIGYAILCLFLAQYITTLMLIEGLYEDLKHSCSK
jgi:cation transporter-like permease